MDKILIHDLCIYGYHGVFEEERRLGQRFVVDIELSVDLSRAAATDRLDDTLNYVRVCEVAQEVIGGKKYDLLERAAGDLIETLMDRFARVQRVKVRLKKPSPPVDLDIGYLGVELERGRS